jgi:hypothetical protein
VLFQACGERIERRGVGDFPAIKGEAFTFGRTDNDPLFAIVHPQRQRAAASIDDLHAEKARRIGCPRVKIIGFDANIPERLQLHRGSPERRKPITLTTGHRMNPQRDESSPVQACSAPVVSSNNSSTE